MLRSRHIAYFSLSMKKESTSFQLNLRDFCHKSSKNPAIESAENQPFELSGFQTTARPLAKYHASPQPPTALGSSEDSFGESASQGLSAHSVSKGPCAQGYH